MQFKQYVPSMIDVSISLKKQFERAEILDVFSSEPVIIPDICPDGAQIQGPTCMEKVLYTTWDKRNIKMKLKVFPSTQGRISHKIYLLVRI